MFAPARIPVAEGKKIENIPKKLPSGPRQLGTKLVAKISAGGDKKKALKNLSESLHVGVYVLPSIKS